MSIYYSQDKDFHFIKVCVLVPHYGEMRAFLVMWRGAKLTPYLERPVLTDSAATTLYKAPRPGMRSFHLKPAPGEVQRLSLKTVN